MLQAIDARRDALIRSQEARREQAYLCPKCKAPVGLRAGKLKVPYFAHYARSQCRLNEPESPRHRALKWLCAEWFAPAQVAWELPLGERRVDAVVAGQLAVECQASPLSLEEWQWRTRNHNACGLAVLWVWDVKRLCRKNTLAEATALERAGRGVWAPAEARLCHQEGGWLCVGDKHGLAACQLERCASGKAAWPDKLFWPDAVRTIHFTKLAPGTGWSSQKSTSGRYLLATLPRLSCMATSPSHA